MTEFRFAHPAALILLVLPLAVYLLPMLACWRPVAGVLRYSDTRLLTGLPRSWRVRLRYLPDMLRLLAWLLLVIALARPQTGMAEEIIQGRGMDIVLALDISGSMAALDFEPDNRLDAAKVVIGEFVSGREFDRIGLVVFARNAFHQVPLTLNYPIFLELLDQVQLVTQLRAVGNRRLDGTAIGVGLVSAANMLRESEAPSRVIILLTDGDNNTGIDPLQAAAAANILGIRIYTIGMGAPGMVSVPVEDGTLMRMESDLNEDLLREIAEIGNGLYFRAEDTAGLDRIYRQIDLLERAEVERRVFVRWQDRVLGLLVTALLLLLGERSLRHTVFQTIP
jgi:Ca-activated chloride channel homolog